MIFRTITSLVFCAFVSIAVAEDASETARRSLAVRSAFARLDADNDRRLSISEFLRRVGDRAVLQRDFQLFDFDADGSLTCGEFASVSGLAAPSLRSPLPDPFQQLVSTAVAALDLSYERWDQRPRELVNAHLFVANFIGSISAGGKRYVTGRILQHADRDADGRISRSEAKWFLEYQLGIRWHEGPLLRESTGRLVRLDHFLLMDEDQNNLLSKQEFLSRSFDRDSAERDFVTSDVDRNESVTYAEFAHFSTGNFFDAVEWFRAADTNLDAQLDQPELAAAADDSRQHLVSSTISAFDHDKDGTLSLQEYRLSMLGNVNYPWNNRPVDTSRDGRLSYDEFVFHPKDLFQLQRRYYFHRLDRDEDGALSRDEFQFTIRSPFSIHVRSRDGTISRRLYQSEQYLRCGWPVVSPDGTRILFHRYSRGRPTGGREQGRIVVMNFDGRNVRDLCAGSHPSWSPGGERFACARRTDGANRIWIMNADGRSGLPLNKGVAPRWSPNGAQLAYLHDNGIWLYDFAAAETRQILSREDHSYQDLGDDIVWSPDGDRLAVLGSHGSFSELVILSLRQKPKIINATSKPKFRGLEDVHLNWSNREGIVFAAGGSADPNSSQGKLQRLVAIQPADPLVPRTIAAFGTTEGWKSACSTADGKWYIAVSSN